MEISAITVIYNRGENMTNNYYVYILTNATNTTVYVGMTHNLEKRMYEHKNHLVNGFSDRYNTVKLVYYEWTDDKFGALAREKQLKKWSRIKKDRLINSMNPDWKDLTDRWNNDIESYLF